jgi:hypothetical protein
MNPDYFKLLDKVSLTLLKTISMLEEDLSASELDAAREVSASIPAVLLAIAVQRLALDLPPDEVSSLLQAMIAKVEIGDFHRGQEFIQPYCPDSSGLSDGEEEDGNDGTGNIPN